ncbi:importin-7-like [Tubulanus polymorphus]|uniref:importin-7-like n=1 Tax=Tubulanus polymorphus TaxID=672921 RepID=UPI003DA3609E
MDLNVLVNVLRHTLDPNHQAEAEQRLNEMHKISGFAPILLQVVMTEHEMAIRQAGVVYLKNMVNQFWLEREVENPTDPIPFSIHEQDRQYIREHIVEAVIQAPTPVRVQLTVCVAVMVKHDYPGRWPGIVDKVTHYLRQDSSMWLGALMCLYQLVKNFEYKKQDEREPLNIAMRILLPMIHERCCSSMLEEDDNAVLIQKEILKIFHALIQYFLPTDLIDEKMFTAWMELVRRIVERNVPEATNQVDEDDRPELPAWKVKKWALHILVRSFERYGSPGNVMKDYETFAAWYLKAFSQGIIKVLLELLVKYRNNEYIAPRVLQQTLNYLSQAVGHSWSWKFLSPEIHNITSYVLFPLMCHNDEDDELWETDPHEYIRIKYDVFEDFVSPVTAAQTLLHSSVAKRKGVLQKTVDFCMSILRTPNVGPRQKDGALHMIGAVADILLKKNIYKDQVEMMIASHVFDEFQSSHGFLRARANWVLHHFSEVKFKNEMNLAQALNLTQTCLCGDKDLPVRVEAAIALQMLITSQPKAEMYTKPHIKPIILELLKIIRETENDDLTGVMQKLVCTFVDEITPLAIEMTRHLAETFKQVVESDSEGSDEKAITAMGILNTIETILTVMEDQKEILLHLEGIVLTVVEIILQQNVLEFYEEVLSLIYSLTCQQISPSMWLVFEKIHEMFQKDGFDYFTDMMPALHNYVTVDTAAFLTSERLGKVYNMCNAILTRESGEDAECHAAKLLEVILLQCKGHIEDNVVTSFVVLALERLTREVRTSELRTMCLQVVIAALYHNTPYMLNFLENRHLPNTNESIAVQFLRQWIHDTDCFLGLHDRKIAVLGLCALMSTNNRPQAVNDISAKILPSALMLFSGLKKAYESRANEDDSDDDDDEEEDDEFVDGDLESDEDEIDEASAEYLEKLQKSANNDDSDDDFSDDGIEETALESYQTPLDDDNCPVDEYQVFKSILESLQHTDPAWYNALTSVLTPDQMNDLKEVFTLADQRLAAAESKRIEQAGGYNFTTMSVPSNFNFGG